MAFQKAKKAARFYCIFPQVAGEMMKLFKTKTAQRKSRQLGEKIIKTPKIYLLGFKPGIFYM